MGEQRIDVRVRSAAPPAAVYALLRDGDTWPVWAPLDRFTLEAPAAGDPQGVGAVRRFHAPGVPPVSSRERVVELVPDRRFSYVLLSGLPLRGYRADVDLTPAPGGGTGIHWHAAFRSAVPGTGGLYRRVLTRFIHRCATGLAEHAAGARG